MFVRENVSLELRKHSWRISTPRFKTGFHWTTGPEPVWVDIQVKVESKEGRIQGDLLR